MTERPNTAVDCLMIPTLVPRNIYNFGYSRFSFIRASDVVNCQSIFLNLLFRSSSQVAPSSCMVAISAIRPAVKALAF